MPWALEIGDEWQYPQEHVEIVEAYPGFADWATSNGTSNTDWYLPSNADLDLVFTE